MNYGTSYYYSFVPNAPALVRKPFPGRGKPVTWETIVDTLPDIPGCLRQIGMANQLSMPSLKEDTAFDANFYEKYNFANPAAIRATNSWKSAVHHMEEVINAREVIRKEEYKIGYEWLLPSKIALVVEI